MQHTKFYYSINGEISAGEQAESLPQDRGLNYGHGLFESMALHSAQVPLLQQHLQRLYQDAPKLGISLEAGSVEACLEPFIVALLNGGLETAVIKIMVTAGTGGRGYQSPVPVKPRIICLCVPMPEDIKTQQSEGVRLWHCDYRLPINPALAGIKHLNRLDQVLARNEWQSSEFADGLMFTADNHLIEAVSANIFINTVTGWATPSLDDAGVNGVMRKLLLEQIFAELEIPVESRTISDEELNDCTEIFICNSIRGLLPVLAVRGSSHEFNLNLAIGAETKMLQSCLRDNYVGF
jgi:4-amino-4-deoxychorismate lyase